MVMYVTLNLMPQKVKQLPLEETIPNVLLNWTLRSIYRADRLFCSIGYTCALHCKPKLLNLRKKDTKSMCPNFFSLLRFSSFGFQCSFSELYSKVQWAWLEHATIYWKVHDTWNTLLRALRYTDPVKSRHLASMQTSTNVYKHGATTSLVRRAIVLHH